MIFRSKIKGVVFEIKATGLAEAVQVAKRVASASPAGGGASGGGGSPGQGGFTFGGGASGGSGASASFGKAPIFPINHERASVMPILPPGPDPFSAAAVQRSFDAGTLTNQQAFTMSRLDAPIWGQPMQGLTKEAILASPGGLGGDDRTRILPGPPAGPLR